MPKSYANTIHTVAKLLAESSYNYDMSGGMGVRMYAEPAEILSKIYSKPVKKVRKQLHELAEKYLKKLWNRRNR